MRLTYFHNLAWDGRVLGDLAKPEIQRDFGTFEVYRDFLARSLERLSENARAKERTEPLGLISTLSSGYDSPTVTALVRGVGCRETFGFDRGRDGHDDSGEPIARRLGVRYHPIATTAWRSQRLAAVPFLASIASEASSVAYKGAEELLARKVVFTGYHGDKVWGTNPTQPGDEFRRTDTAGVDLSEYRLWAGFIHCPVAFLGIRQIRDIQAITMSAELAPWCTRPRYNRPICRRILEENGVPGDMFALRKQATAQRLLRPGDFLTRGMRLDYYRWIRSRRQDWIRLGEQPPHLLAQWRALLLARIGLFATRSRDTAFATRVGRPADVVLARVAQACTPDKPFALQHYVFHWAVDRAKQRYPDPRRRGAATRST